MNGSKSLILKGKEPQVGHPWTTSHDEKHELYPLKKKKETVNSFHIYPNMMSGLLQLTQAICYIMYCGIYKLSVGFNVLGNLTDVFASSRTTPQTHFLQLPAHDLWSSICKWSALNPPKSWHFCLSLEAFPYKHSCYLSCLLTGRTCVIPEDLKSRHQQQNFRKRFRKIITGAWMFHSVNNELKCQIMREKDKNVELSASRRNFTARQKAIQQFWDQSNISNKATILLF